MPNYRLLSLDKKDLDTFKVAIVADSNDADYITTITTYPKEKFEGRILNELIELLKNYSGDYNLEDYCNDWLAIPSSENGTCHTLESVDIEYIDNDGKLWNVELNVK